MAPSPTATTLPFCGFSLAVSGRTMPLAVVSSSSIGLTISRSPRGFSFIREPPLSVWVVLKVEKRRCGAKSSSRTPWHSHLESANWAKDSEASVHRQEPAAKEGGDSLAAAPHHPVVVPLEGRPQQRREEVHPGLGRPHVPLVEHR